MTLKLVIGQWFSKCATSVLSSFQSLEANGVAHSFSGATRVVVAAVNLE